MTTPEIAGLLKKLWVGCIYMRDSNTNCVVDPEKTDALLAKAANALERQADEIERLRSVLERIAADGQPLATGLARLMLGLTPP
jgi:hypothetical protein